MSAAASDGFIDGYAEGWADAAQYLWGFATSTDDRAARGALLAASAGCRSQAKAIRAAAENTETRAGS